jgi:hypothetical protein
LIEPDSHEKSWPIQPLNSKYFLLSCIPNMSARLLLIATLLTVVLPLLVCIGIFFVALPWWTDRRLRSDLAVQQRLRLAVSDGSLAWVIDPDPTTPTRLPYFLLMVAALAGLVITSVETATFASRSGVPDLWYTAGVFASALVLVGPFAVAWICKGPLCRSVERALGRHANEKLSFAAPSLHEIGAVGRDIDEAYAAMGLRSRLDIVRLGREALLAHAWLGRDSALAEVIRIRTRADHDLRNIQYLAHLSADARIALKRARIAFQDLGAPPDALDQLDDRMRARPLVDALEEARWPQAHELLEAIQADLGKLLDFGMNLGTRECTMPETAAEAFRILNVSEDTPLDVIKSVIKAYRRVWHPDLAQNDVERQRCTLRIQQINVAWDLIQRARA